MIKVWILLVPLLSVLAQSTDNEVLEYNNRPIVGILAQEFPSAAPPEYKNYKSFISASYVKFIESAGARVVPLWINKTRSYYEDIMGQINGILFPGGSVKLDAKYGFAEAGATIYDIAQTLNKKGDYFPLWGTCQGFELLAYLGANKTNPLTTCKSANVNLKLEFLPDYSISQMYGSAPKEIILILSNRPVTINFHQYCLTQENVTRYMGDINWRLITLNEDSNGLKFVSSMESRSFPFYGVQFHPEKNIFEWLPKQKTAHSFDAVKASQYFANFFVNEARKNFHYFTSETEETKSLIYNYSPKFVGIGNHTINEQLYLFEW